MKYVMYIFVNKSLGMSAGKMAVQVGHAVVYALDISTLDVVHEWRNNMQIKVVLEAKDETELKQIESELGNVGILTREVHDAGLTEIAPDSFTALAVQIVDKEKHKETFREYKTYKG